MYLFIPKIDDLTCIKTVYLPKDMCGDFETMLHTYRLTIKNLITVRSDDNG